MNLNEHLDFSIGETAATGGPVPGIRTAAPSAPSPSGVSPETQGTVNGPIDRTPPQRIPNHVLIASRLCEDGGFCPRKQELREVQKFMAFRSTFVVELEKYSDTTVRAAYKSETFTGVRQSLEERILQAQDAKRNLKQQFRDKTETIAPILRRMLERGVLSAETAVDLMEAHEQERCDFFQVTHRASPCLEACKAALRILKDHLAVATNARLADQVNVVGSLRLLGVNLEDINANFAVDGDE